MSGGGTKVTSVPLSPDCAKADMILVVVEDLIFLSKIQDTARLLGVPVEPVEPRKVEERTAEGPVSAVIVDLNHHSGVTVNVVRAIKTNPSTRHVYVLGFLSHVQANLAAAGREAGCDRIIARSAMAEQLPQLLEKLASNASKSPPSR